jgi:cytochrome c-type biogenesis protein CcmH
MSIGKLFQIILIMLLSGFAFAAVDTFEFTDKNQQQRYKQFIDEMRCPKCDNQSLSGSNSPIAEDLRQQLYTMVQDNKSDEEIVTYMVDRYGDFILYKPRLTIKTMFLWGAPILFLLIGLVILIVMLRSRKKAAANQELSANERETLDRLLQQYSTTTKNNTAEDK